MGHSQSYPYFHNNTPYKVTKFIIVQKFRVLIWSVEMFQDSSEILGLY